MEAPHLRHLAALERRVDPAHVVARPRPRARPRPDRAAETAGADSAAGLLHFFEARRRLRLLLPLVLGALVVAARLVERCGERADAAERRLGLRRVGRLAQVRVERGERRLEARETRNESLLRRAGAGEEGAHHHRERRAGAVVGELGGGGVNLAAERGDLGRDPLDTQRARELERLELRLECLVDVGLARRRVPRDDVQQGRLLRVPAAGGVAG